MKVSSQPSQATDNPSGCDSQGEGGGRNTREILSCRIGPEVSAAAACDRCPLAVQNVSAMGWLGNLGQDTKETHLVSLEMAEAPGRWPAGRALGQRAEGQRGGRKGQVDKQDEKARWPDLHRGWALPSLPALLRCLSASLCK